VGPPASPRPSSREPNRKKIALTVLADKVRELV